MRRESVQFALCAFSCSTLHCNMCTHSCNLYCCAKMICHFYRAHTDIYLFIYSEAAPSPDCPLEKFCCKSSDPRSQQKIIAALISTPAAAHGVGDKIWRSRNALQGGFGSCGQTQTPQTSHCLGKLSKKLNFHLPRAEVEKK